MKHKTKRQQATAPIAEEVKTETALVLVEPDSLAFGTVPSGGLEVVKVTTMPSANPKTKKWWHWKRRPIVSPEDAPKIKKLPNWGWIKLVAGLGLITFGIPLSVIWMAYPLNTFLGLAVIGCIGGGIFMVVKGWKGRQEGGRIQILKPGKPPKGPANTCNTVARKIGDQFVPEAIEYLQAEKPTGALRQVTNDKKWYYFNWVVREEGKTDIVTPAILPDNTTGLTPKEFVIAVVRNAYSLWMDGLTQAWDMQTVKIWVLVGIIAIEVFALLVI